jgi:sulfur carrier protein
MRIILNGQAQQVPDGSDILKMIGQFCQDTAPVMTEINGQVVARPEWEGFILKDGDTVELVSFVGGG